MTLKISYSCEIEDLISELIDGTSKTYDDVEEILFKYGIYPESTKTFLTKSFGNIVVSLEEQDQWLEDALEKIFDELNINQMYVTLAI